MGIDQDPTALLMAGKRLGAFCAEGRAVLVSGNFEEMGRLAAANGLERGSVDGILLDIGTSSLQIDEAERGFSFMRDGPLDMRMDPRQVPPLHALKCMGMCMCCIHTYIGMPIAWTQARCLLQSIKCMGLLRRQADSI